MSALNLHVQAVFPSLIMWGVAEILLLAKLTLVSVMPAQPKLRSLGPSNLVGAAFPSVSLVGRISLLSGVVFSGSHPLPSVMKWSIQSWGESPPIAHRYSCKRKGDRHNYDGSLKPKVISKIASIFCL